MMGRERMKCSGNIQARWAASPFYPEHFLICMGISEAYKISPAAHRFTRLNLLLPTALLFPQISALAVLLGNARYAEGCATLARSSDSV